MTVMREKIKTKSRAGATAAMAAVRRDRAAVIGELLRARGPAYTATLRDRSHAFVAGVLYQLHLDAYNDDQPRAPDGRFGSVAGSGGAPAPAREAESAPAESKALTSSRTPRYTSSSAKDNNASEKTALAKLSVEVPTKALHSLRIARGEANDATESILRAAQSVDKADLYAITQAAGALGITAEFSTGGAISAAQDLAHEADGDFDDVGEISGGSTALDLGASNDALTLFSPNDPDDFDEGTPEHEAAVQADFSKVRAARAEAAKRILAHASEARAALEASKTDPEKLTKTAADMKVSEKDFKAESKELGKLDTDAVIEDDDADEEGTAALQGVLAEHENFEPKASFYGRAAKIADKLNKAIDKDIAKLDKTIAKLETIASAVNDTDDEDEEEIAKADDTETESVDAEDE